MATFVSHAQGAAGGHSAQSQAPARDADRATATAAVAVAGLAALAFIAGFLTPVPGGGICIGSCAAYPFDDPALVRDFVPVSFYWMYPAIGMLLAQVVFTASLAVPGRAATRLPAILALALTLMGAGLLLGDYAIQLAVVAPSLLRGEGAAVAGLSLFNPHGVFVALEDVGYWTLGLAFLGVAAALGGATTAECVARYAFLAGGVLAVGALPVLIAVLGPDLGYAYEILVITAVDLALLLGASCVALGLARSAGAAARADGAASRTAWQEVDR